MQKSTKRLLSMLMVLALVLTLAPAGILAVETKATETEPTVTPGQANLPAGVQDKIDAAAAVKAWADGIKEAIKDMPSTEKVNGNDVAIGWKNVNTVEAAKSCPACGQTNVSWTQASGWNTSNIPAGTEAEPKYYHLVVDRGMSAGADFVSLHDYTTVCVLWVGNYTVTCKDVTATDAKGGDVVLAGKNAVLNIMGDAKLTSTSELAPLFNFNTATATGTTLNLYGGTYTHSKSSALSRALIRMDANTSHVVNIYNDTVIGPAASQTANTAVGTAAGQATAYCNVRLNSGTINMYGGTIRNGYSSTQNQGWNVFNYSGTFNMYGGTITGGSGVNGATGTNLFNRGTFNMYGGTVSGGQVYSYQGGGTVYVGTGAVGGTAPANIPTMTLYGGKIIDGVHTHAGSGYGGNINIGGAHGAKAQEKVGYGKLVLPENSTALISGGKAPNGFGGNIYIHRGGELQVAGGFIQGGLTEGNNAKNGGNIYTEVGSTMSITGGSITGGRSSINGGNIWSTISYNVSGATITGGKGANGANIFAQTGPVTLEASNTISGGVATAAGGNLFAGSGCTLTVKCDVTGGKGANGGNIHADYGSTVVLDGATVSGGTATSATYGSNIRINKATLKLVGDTNVASGILVDSKSYVAGVNVDSTFSGNVYTWNTTLAAPGAAVPNSTCDGAFPGTLKNGNWIVAAKNGDTDAIYANIEIIHDGASGLKYPASGVVYNGTLTPAASAQAAVDTFVADMENESVEVKPQYVYTAEDVVLSNGKEVAIWPGADINVTGEGVVLGVDRANDTYGTTGGSITIGDGVTVANEVTAGGRHYIALNDVKSTTPNKYTFHRLESALTNVTINKDNAGLYYKARYQFDADVKERLVSYGVLVKLDEAVYSHNYAKLTSSDDVSGYTNQTLSAASHGVYGIFKSGNTVDRNQQNGVRKLYGNPYVVVNVTNADGAASQNPMFDAKSVGMSLSDAMELANQKWEALSAENQVHLIEFVNTWKEKNAWTEDLLAKLTNFNLD